MQDFYVDISLLLVYTLQPVSNLGSSEAAGSVMDAVSLVYQ